jgi:hypothetical protein
VIGKGLYSVMLSRESNPHDYSAQLVTARTKRGASRIALKRRPRRGRGTYAQQGYVVRDVRVARA